MPKKGKVKPQRQQVPQVPSAHSRSAGPMNVPGVPNSSMNAMLGAPNNSRPNLKSLMNAKTEQQMGIKLPSSNNQPAENAPQGNAANEQQKINRNYIRYASGGKPKLKKIKGIKKSGAKLDSWVEKKEKELQAIEADAWQKDAEGGNYVDEYEAGLISKYDPNDVKSSLTPEEMASLKGYTREPGAGMDDASKKKLYSDPKYFNQLDQNERDEAWKGWSSSYKGMNNFLRFNGKQSYQEDADLIPEQYHEGIKKNINNAASAIKKSTMKENRIVYRGMSRGGLKVALGLNEWPASQEEAQALVGMKISDAGFTSTSADKSTAKGFAEGNQEEGPGALMTIILPKGTQGMYLSGGISQFTGAASEHELLLQKGTEMTIKSATMTKKGGMNLTAEVTSQNDEMLDERPQDVIEAEDEQRQAQQQRSGGGFKGFFKNIFGKIKNLFKKH